MLRPATVLVAALLLGVTPARAQTAADSAAIRAAVQDYVEGFYQGDSTRHARSIRPDVYKYGFWRARDSVRYLGEQMTRPQFDGYTRRVKARGQATPASAPREIRLLDVLDQTAAAKLTASWGVDYLLLGKYDGRWMISSVMWQSAPRAAAPRTSAR